MRVRSDPLQKVAETGQIRKQVEKNGYRARQVRVVEGGTQDFLSVLYTSTPTTHAFPLLTPAKPSGQFCASPLQAALSLHD